MTFFVAFRWNHFQTAYFLLECHKWTFFSNFPNFDSICLFRLEVFRVEVVLRRNFEIRSFSSIRYRFEVGRIVFVHYFPSKAKLWKVKQAKKPFIFGAIGLAGYILCHFFDCEVKMAKVLSKVESFVKSQNFCQKPKLFVKKSQLLPKVENYDKIVDSCKINGVKVFVDSIAQNIIVLI